MNTQLAFAFGMLTMVAISMLVVIVLGMVKVMKLAKQVQYIQSELDRTVTHIYHRIEQESAGVHRRFDEVHSIVDRRFDDTHGRVDNEVRSLVEEVHNMQRYIDSRFDKFENRIKSMPAKPMEPVEPDMTGIEMVIEKTKGKKQLLKD